MVRFWGVLEEITVIQSIHGYTYVDMERKETTFASLVVNSSVFTLIQDEYEATDRVLCRNRPKN